ncbi:Protein trichome birefringence-like 18 [Forsythia ovata]|uniref:Protein trichome birefringence-like 18 n=1 Tax=Forsythia ovata TaxID=205694 RepID=A0ABD1WKM3_9LAMI
MTSVSMKELPTMAYPKTLLSIVVSVGALASFLILGSTLLVSQPIGSTVRGYFYGVDNLRKINSVPMLNNSVSESNQNVNVVEDRRKSNPAGLGGHGIEVSSQLGDSGSAEHQLPQSQVKNESSDLKQVELKDLKDEQPHSKLTREEKGNESLEDEPPHSKLTREEKGNESSEDEPPHSMVTQEGKGNKSSSLSDNSKGQENAVVSSNNTQAEQKDAVTSSTSATIYSQENLVDSGCDLYYGKWIYDSTGPLYTNNSCPVLSQMQNCQGNGRPDKDYENWRWKPSQCDLPRFDAKMFLEIMRGKTLAFIGDSVARNQMESMLCILWQVEVPKNRGNKRMQRYYFTSTSTTIVRIWSSWLVHQTPEPFDFAPSGVVKLHLDIPDEGFMEFIKDFDVIVLSSGHWFAKQSVYILNNEIVGGQLWWPDKSRQKKIDNIEAFGISVETILASMVTHPNYTGLTIVRSFSPDHYEGGAWNAGGSCTGKVRPALDGELVENGFTNIMHEKQVTGFNRAMKRKTNKSKLKLMDITKAFSHRLDGHPGPYRSLDPHKITKRGPDGRPPPQDCLHWCMPGPVDTWNELVFEIIKREFGDRQIIPL